MRFVIKRLYIFTIIIGITFSLGLSYNSSSSYASFIDKDDNILKTNLIMTNNISFEQVSNIKNTKIILLTDGLFSDAGWGAFSYNAVRALEQKYGYDVDFKENVDVLDMESILVECANAGYDLIIAHGFEWGEAVLKVSKDYPDTKFIVFPGFVKSPNVSSIFPMQQEATYLLGALAAMMSKTNIIGFIGGKAYPNIINIYEGYKQGALHIDPTIKILVTYLNDWKNPSKGKEAPLSQINKGVDILLHVADTSGLGVIEVAKEHQIFVFGSVLDQNKLAPTTVLTSFVFDVEKAFDQVIKMIQKGNFTGQIFKPGLEPYKGAPGDGIIYLPPFSNFENKIPENVKIKINQLKNDIIRKNIVVPERYTITSTFNNYNN
jgi:basic membrane protein A and related proteins